MTSPHLHSETDSMGRATLTLNRPEVHNAFDDNLIAALISELRRLEEDRSVRVVLFAARGPTFCAGADIAWMRRTAGYSRYENLGDAAALAELLKTLDRLPKPTIALVQGPAYGGGAGLVACCDIALAAPRASFRFSEVRLGLVPAVISPYVVAAIGPRAARRYFLTTEPIEAQQALRLGLVHEVLREEKLQARGEHLSRILLENAPGAMAAAKRLVTEVARSPIDDALIAATAERIAEARASSEGREGLSAFLEKRPPRWEGK